MHELSIAQNILDTVTTSVSNKSVSQVLKIHISVGALSGISPDALEHSFNYMPKTPIFESTKLQINKQPIVIFCPVCQISTTLEDEFALKCSKCGQLTNNVTKGRELTIDNVEVAYESNS